ncbi:pseudaminic acid synthase [Albibacterium sp.]|uniref:pseudaminic acid synthase n=1 Tax=Albibacterium sp. TaxID=2952885 RepID=UPI002BA993A1|nr:pseudaminic acid synthase [Albibacterium sp.]HUH18899.1 pseudaminic acid synthase [Albibacterium sp.]
MWNRNDVFIIAEMSANHNNNFDIAVETINAMALAGADAVKVQTFKPDSLTLNVDNDFFGPRKDGLWKGKTPYEVFSQGAMPYDWQPKLKEVAENLGMVFFSSPFDLEGVKFLESINVPLYKIASFEITDIPLIESVAKTGKPIIISTGVASISDIELAVNTCRSVGNNDVTLLKCTSEYPATADMANLLTIPNLKETFDVKVGVSDHTMGNTIPVVAIALGARVVEKHFILDRNLGGPDAAFSMEPPEFKEMVQACRDAYNSLGKITYTLTERNKLRRRSLFVVEDIEKGELLTEKNIRSVRPGNGMPPRYLKELIGKVAPRNYKKGDPFLL